MNRSPPLIGQKFGMLTVLQRLPNRGDTAIWLTRCECGNERKASTWELQAGKIVRCGRQCARVEFM